MLEYTEYKKWQNHRLDYSRSNAILEKSFFHIKINSEGFISVKRSKLLSGVHECFYLSSQFYVFWWYLKFHNIRAVNKTN